MKPWAIKTLTVVLVVGAFALWIVPNLLDSKVHYSEWSALGSLRNLSNVEEEFRKGPFVDLDGDGSGEYGTLRELTGATAVRSDPSGSTRGRVLQPPLLSPAMVPHPEDGIVVRLGYLFRVFLPGSGDTAVSEGSIDSPLSGPVDVDAAETRWCAYAWPDDPFGRGGSDHIGGLFVDQGGEVWRTPNRDHRYLGSHRAPPWDAAMPEDGRGIGWTAAPTDRDAYRGRDGNVWTRCR